MCDCKSDIEAKLTERFAQKEPKGRGHQVELQGYGMVIIDNTAKVLPCMTYEAFAYMPLVKGGERPKKSTGSMFFTYCPFCGERVDKGQSAQAQPS
jgi:hypothetical protein